MSTIEAPTEVSPEDEAVKDALKKIAKLFTDLSHPMRLKIVLLIAEQGPTAPKDMWKPLNSTLGTVAYHVRELEKMGLIVLHREDRVRGAVKHTYKLTARGRNTVKLMKEWAVARSQEES